MAPKSPAGAAKVLDIRKYANRRYYDSTHSRHMTLEEIRSFIQQGYDLRVTDGKDGADITAQTLTQIILELDTPKLDSLPVPLLVRIIRVNDQLVKDFIDKYFNQALKSFLDYQQELEEQLRRTHGLPSMFSSVSLWTKAMLQPFTAGFAKPTETTGENPAAVENTRLQNQIHDLQEQVKTLRNARSRLRPKRSTRSERSKPQSRRPSENKNAPAARSFKRA